MTERDHRTDDGNDPDGVKCNPNCEADRQAGPVREAGGTTGDNNLSPAQANRTGGATSGVGTDAQRPARAGLVPPSA